MLKPASCAGLLVMVVGLQGTASPAGCWKGSTTNGSNPGLNTTLLCIAASGAVDLRVYFPNTPIQEPPTTCVSRGRLSEAPEDAFAITMQQGRCENGSSMGAYEFECALAEDDAMSCSHRSPAGDLILTRFEKIFP